MKKEEKDALALKEFRKLIRVSKDSGFYDDPLYWIELVKDDSEDLGIGFTRITKEQYDILKDEDED